MNYKKFAYLVLIQTIVWMKSHGTLTLGVMTVEDGVNYNKHVTVFLLHALAYVVSDALGVIVANLYTMYSIWLYQIHYT